jgi:hypothetical protein
MQTKIHRILKKVKVFLGRLNTITIFAPTIKEGDVAQSVEQRTENPCVGGSIPSITTPTEAEKSHPNGWLFRFVVSVVMVRSDGGTTSASEKNR